MKDHRFRLLVVDDDPLVLQSIRMAMPSNWSMSGAPNLDHLEETDFDAALVDMHLEGERLSDGGLVIRNISQSQPNLEIVAMSGDLSRQTMEYGLQAGATRFIAKPLSVDALHLTLSKIEALLQLRRQATQTQALQKTWIGVGPASQKLHRQIANLRGEKAPILIEGPSGVGKEIVATLLNRQEGEEKRPFVAINVAAIPENLFESEVFGHVKGAFTGAAQSRQGLIEAARGGDLFLDEIEALPESQQAKLLRFLESGEVRRVGSHECQRVESRILAATNRCLKTMVEKGSFREDLLWRLNGHRLKIPPLNERSEDIPLLAQFFTEMEFFRHQKTWTEDGLAALQSHDWPGNVRELKRFCEQITLASPLPILRAEDVHGIIHPKSTVAKNFAKPNIQRGLATLMAEYEAQVIETGLDETKDVDATAKLLGISRSSLYKKIKDHRIEL